MDDEELIRKKFSDLAKRSYKNNQYTFTDFLGAFEQDIFYRMQKDLNYAGYKFFQDSDRCERNIIRFGNEELLGYDEEFEVSCIVVEPLIKKFADELTHRDYLGALMNLGIDRGIIGDIYIRDNIAYIMCLDRMTGFIQDNLDTIKHTHVKVNVTKEIPKVAEPDIEERKIIVSSGRLDGVIAKVYNLSRSQSIEMFRQGRIFLNGRSCENNSVNLKPDDIVSVRGHGRFVYRGEEYETKKGKTCVRVGVY